MSNTRFDSSVLESDEKKLENVRLNFEKYETDVNSVPLLPSKIIHFF